MINPNSNETVRSGTRPTSSSSSSSSQTQVSTSCQTQISSFSQTEVEEKDLAEVPFQPNSRFYLAFTAISVVTLAAAIDATSLSIALPILTKELKGSAIEAFWTGTSFLITSAILMPLYAALSHIFGRKSLILVGCFFFAGGSVIGAIATDMKLMLIGRSIQGAGAGGVVVLGEIIITDLVPLNQRGKWLGWLGSMWTIGGLIGPLSGGTFAQYVSWRWVFWINLPFLGIGAVLLQLFLTQEPIPGELLHKLARVDWLGAIIFLVSSATFLVPLTCAGILFPWSDWHTIVPLFAGFDGLLAFAYYERFIAKEPMIRLTIFNNWTLRSTYLQTVIHALIFWVMIYYLPLYYQVVQSYTPLFSGIAMLPQTLVVSPMTVIIGILIAMTGKYRWAVYEGWALATIGAGLLILLDYHTEIAVFIGINVVVCLGVGTLIPAMNFAVQAAASPMDCGFAVAFYVFLRQFGEGLGVAVGGAIFQNRIKDNLSKIPEFASRAEEYSRDATAIGDVISEMTLGQSRDNLIHAYANALKVVWMVMCILSFIALLTTALVKTYSMNQKHETEQGFNPQQRCRSSEVSVVGA